MAHGSYSKRSSISSELIKDILSKILESKKLKMTRIDKIKDIFNHFVGRSETNKTKYIAKTWELGTNFFNHENWWF